MHPAASAQRFTAFGALSAAEVGALERLAGPVALLRAGRDVRGGWRAHAGPFFLHEGWALSSVDLPDGGRQILKVHLPGDIMGAPGLPYEAPVETLTTLTAARVSPMSLVVLGEVFSRAPRLAALLFLAAQEERVLLMDRLTAMGRMDAERSIVSLLVHLHERLSERRPDGDVAAFDLPMTQPQIADALGLTSVHVSRVMRRLERSGRIRRCGRLVELMDVDALRRSAALPHRKVRRDLSWLPAHA